MLNNLFNQTIDNNETNNTIFSYLYVDNNLNIYYFNLWFILELLYIKKI